MLTHIGTTAIETERLILRRFQSSDCGDMMKYWVSDPAVQHMYMEPVYETEAEVNGLLEKYITAYENEDNYRWAVIFKETGACIGQIAFYLVNSKNRFAEIEYCLGRGFHRKGLMTEACKAVIAFGFEEVGFHRIQIAHRGNNAASQGVIRNCGFVFEGVSRDYFLIDGTYDSRMNYSLLCSEWQGK